MFLALKNVLFTLLVPGTVAVVVPLLIVRSSGATPVSSWWMAAALIAIGLALYAWCLWNFATVGRGTPGPWDPTEKVVATGPYRWVRNPMYVAVLTVVLGEAWLFASWPLVIYAAVIAAIVHTFVVVYEEPTLTEQFGDDYLAYRQEVGRWMPRVPRGKGAS